MMGGEAVPDRMAWSDQTGQKPRCIRGARKVLLHTYFGGTNTESTDRGDGQRCLFVSASDLSIA